MNYSHTLQKRISTILYERNQTRVKYIQILEEANHSIVKESKAMVLGDVGLGRIEKEPF